MLRTIKALFGRLSGLPEAESRARMAERFREKLIAAFGEEPAILMGEYPSAPPHPHSLPPEGGKGLVEVGLADYSVWKLKARRAGIYRCEAEGFRCVAGFQTCPRGGQTLKVLSPARGIGPPLSAPIVLNGTQWGVLSVETALPQRERNRESLTLELFANAILNCLRRKNRGEPGLEAQRAQRETQALRELQELWVSIRPKENPVTLAIRDKDRESQETLNKFFREWGFKITPGTQRHYRYDVPPVRRTELDLVLSVGTWTVRIEAPALEAVQRLPKPCRFARLAGAVFEAGIEVAVRGRTRETGARPGLQCLIVDEERETREALREHLERMGALAWSVPTAENALRVTDRLKPNLVFLNLELPGRDGREALSRIRRAVPESRVVVLTAWAHEYSEEMLNILRPDAYCVKPVSLETLTEIATGAAEGGPLTPALSRKGRG